MNDELKTDLLIAYPIGWFWVSFLATIRFVEERRKEHPKHLKMYARIFVVSPVWPLLILGAVIFVAQDFLKDGFVLIGEMIKTAFGKEDNASNTDGTSEESGGQAGERQDPPG